jgi:hypothetical protein
VIDFRAPSVGGSTHEKGGKSLIKGINMHAKVHVGNDPTAAANLEQSLPALFAGANPGLTLTVKHASPPDEKGDVTIRIYIEGEQDPAADFAALTRAALNKTIEALNANADKGAGQFTENVASGAATSQTPVHIKELQETEGDEEDTDVTLAPSLRAPATAPAAQPGPTPAATPTQPTAPAPSAPEAQKAAPTGASSRAPWWAFWKRGN